MECNIVFVFSAMLQYFIVPGCFSGLAKALDFKNELVMYSQQTCNRTQQFRL